MAEQKKTTSRKTPKAAAAEAPKKAKTATESGGEATPKRTRKSTVAASTPADKTVTITPEQRYRMISDAAFFRAERRGFVGGDAAQDWHDAEAEIDMIIKNMRAD